MLVTEIITDPPSRATKFETFDERLRKIMAAREVTAGDLGHRINMQPSNFSRLCRGLTKPTFWTLCELANALNISMDYLAGFTDEPRPLRKES